MVWIVWFGLLGLMIVAAVLCFFLRVEAVSKLVLIPAWVFANVLDMHSTWLFVRADGVAKEGNPIMRFAFERIGFWPSMAVKMGVVALMVIYLRQINVSQNISDRAGYSALIVGTVLMLLVAASNYSGHCF